MANQRPALIQPDLYCTVEPRQSGSLGLYRQFAVWTGVADAWLLHRNDVSDADTVSALPPQTNPPENDPGQKRRYLPDTRDVRSMRRRSPAPATSAPVLVYGLTGFRHTGVGTSTI